MPPTINPEKYLDVLQFLLRPVEDGGGNNELLGRVKLMKLLYFADFEHFYRHGESITGDTYIKREFGPVPLRANQMLGELTTAGRLKTESVKVHDYDRYKYELEGTPAPIEHLTWQERTTLKEIVVKWKDHTSQEIVAASHGDPPWQRVQYGAVIPYHAVYYRDEVVQSDEDEATDLTQVRAAS